MPKKLASASSRDIIIAWATPVSVAQLGARLFAYAETKAAITTFHLVVRHTKLTACRKLPPELISMITSKVRDIAFERRMKVWVKISRCLANTCTTLSHVPRADLESLAGIVSSSWAENDDWLAEQFAEEAAEAHAKDVTRYCRVLTSLKGRSKFAKCVQIFTRDFGIHPYFMVHKIYDRHGYGIEVVHAKAYLTLPLLRTPLSSDPGPGIASFSVSSVLDSSALVEPTEDQLRQFTSATNVLDLHVCNWGEDEMGFEDEPTMREAPRSDGDTDSGKSEDGDDDGNGGESDGAESDSAKSYGADSEGLTSDGAMLQGQETTVNSDGAIKTIPTAPESSTGQAERSSHMDVESREEETWPQLMILGCGELEAHDSEYW